ncbi:dihydrofolate reductase-like domain-containing protein [Phaeosphaeria sp. MPI-PUGE-AT-0046c]|nr:dihydrofolate reductase-like domain-containing protein [Phaeosphaeria sp. MPI-PUGE-AT-0046c]
MSTRPTLTLILAATPSLGIGKNGALPWPLLKKEMGYFARVTKRVPTSSSKINAVLMGRKTWDSIPPKFRPLKDRLNIVITRDTAAFEKSLESSKSGAGGGVEGPLIASGIVDALTQLEKKEQSVERIYVIGGASIYQTALELPQTKRVLLTKIHKEYDCDTFFPVDLEASTVWRRAGRSEVEDFTGESVSEEGVEEQGVRFEFCLFEKE